MEQVLTGAVVAVRDANPAVLLASESRGQRLTTAAGSQRQARLTD
jgi:hypothetical protein